MKTFRFPLERALEWRRTELSLEEHRLKQSNAELRRLENMLTGLEAARRAAERSIREAPFVDGSELGSLAAFLSTFEIRRRTLLDRRRELERRAAAQHQVLLEARRRVRLMEKLRDRRFADWKDELSRESEGFAAESYLARFAARRRANLKKTAGRGLSEAVRSQGPGARSK